MRRIRKHLTYANVMATLAVFLVLGGGTALASYVISSNSQVGPGTISGHTPRPGQHANIIAGTVNSQDVTDESLDGTDIKNRSGVDTCQAPLTAKYGPICAGSDGGARSWPAAVNYCANFGLRLPSVAEAIALANNYDVPGVSSTGGEAFWTDDAFLISGSEYGVAVREEGTHIYQGFGTTQRTVCVTDPSA